MRNTKKAFLEVIAKVGEKGAKLGANSASMLGFHQAKEPEALKDVTNGEFKFLPSMTLEIYNKNGVASNNLVARYTTEAANGTPNNTTYYQSIKSVHIPRTFRDYLNNDDNKVKNVDYALIYVDADLSDYICDIGCITDEFKQTNSDIVSTGFTSALNTVPYDRYYSTGKIKADSDKYKLSTYALSYNGQSGGPLYYEANYFGEPTKTMVGITTCGSFKVVNGEITECIVDGGIRITPTLLHFFLNNTHLS